MAECFSLLNFEDEYYLKEFLRYVLNKGFANCEIKSYKWGASYTNYLNKLIKLENE